MLLKACLISIAILIADSSMADPKADVEKLMNEFVGFAEQMLSEHGEFLPYGAAMRPDGSTVSVAAYDGDDHPPSQELIGLLQAGLREAGSNGEYVATAIFFDVRVTPPDLDEKTDAIAVTLDHRDEYSIVMFFPYTLEGRKVIFGSLLAQAGESAIFGR